jgi:hypothetical protein
MKDIESGAVADDYMMEHVRIRHESIVSLTIQCQINCIILQLVLLCNLLH